MPPTKSDLQSSCQVSTRRVASAKRMWMPTGISVVYEACSVAVRNTPSAWPQTHPMATPPYVDLRHRARQHDRQPTWDIYPLSMYRWVETGGVIAITRRRRCRWMISNYRWHAVRRWCGARFMSYCQPTCLARNRRSPELIGSHFGITSNTAAQLQIATCMYGDHK